MSSTQGEDPGDYGKQHEDPNRNFKISSFLTKEQSDRVRRELEEDERRKQQPDKKNKGKEKAKDPSKAAKEEVIAEDEVEEAPKKKRGPGNFGHQGAAEWTEQESLTMLKIIRDAPTDTWQQVGDAMKAAGYNRTTNGMRPQYSKLVGGNRDSTVEQLPGKIADLEQKMASG